ESAEDIEETEVRLARERHKQKKKDQDAGHFVSDVSRDDARGLKREYRELNQNNSDEQRS
ncbi:MAG: hypothetical protein KDI18_05500, partial [Gammaproteobacteria bacterium]|nr:hypothetical protein [Gammaproteobacteria bacterium]